MDPVYPVRGASPPWCCEIIFKDYNKVGLLLCIYAGMLIGVEVIKLYQYLTGKVAKACSNSCQS